MKEKIKVATRYICVSLLLPVFIFFFSQKRTVTVVDTYDHLDYVMESPLENTCSDTIILKIACSYWKKYVSVSAARKQSFFDSIAVHAGCIHGNTCPVGVKSELSAWLRHNYDLSQNEFVRHISIYSAYQVIKSLQKQYGFSVVFKEHALVPDGISIYFAPENRMYLSPEAVPIVMFLAELSHVEQYHDRSRFAFYTHYLQGIFRTCKHAIKHQKKLKDAYDREYHVQESFENEAHKVIEKRIHNIVRQMIDDHIHAHLAMIGLKHMNTR